MCRPSASAGDSENRSTSDSESSRPYNALRHIGIIPNGNRSWATRRGVSLSAAYCVAAETLGRCLRHLLFSVKEIQTITLYLLSSKNLERADTELDAFLEAGIAFGRDVLPAILNEFAVALKLVWIDRLEHRLKGGAAADLSRTFITRYTSLAETSSGNPRRLYALLAYDPFEELRRAIKQTRPFEVSGLQDLSVPVELDLVIRTGPHSRLSSFVPLQAAEAELVFLPNPFPDLQLTDIDRAVRAFLVSQRRSGR